MEFVSLHNIQVELIPLDLDHLLTILVYHYFVTIIDYFTTIIGHSLTPSVTVILFKWYISHWNKHVHDNFAVAMYMYMKKHWQYLFSLLLYML